MTTPLPYFLDSIWLIPLFPLGTAALMLFFGRRLPNSAVSVLCVGSVLVSFVYSVGAFLQLRAWPFAALGYWPEKVLFDWVPLGAYHTDAGQLAQFTAEWGFLLDPLSAVMILVVTGVGLLIHIYSIGYMHGDRRFTWFYVALSLFTAAMLNVVIADNLFQLIVGWEVMGFCSYILIGHWWEEHVNSSSAIKAFITTRIGDVPFLFGVFVLVAATGFTTSNIQEIGHLVSGGEMARGVVAIAALLLFGGAVGKSAQFPLHVWLPDAMAGPTPVSALIHAATMVAAGVYMVGRTYEVFLHADPWVLQLVGAIGVTTAFGAGLLGLVQDDIKRVLAYSTISQLGYMITLMAAGPAGRNAAFFHLFTHAFFKALLFLGSGSVIHACHTNNMSEMGGLRKTMPVTFWTFTIGSLALAGVPPLAGFFSKDELLVALEHDHQQVLFWLLLAAAAVTAFYTARMVLQTFFGEYRGHGHPHESPLSMTGPLVALAGATVLVGFLGVLIMLRPGSGLFGAAALAALFGAVVHACNMLLLRRMRGVDPPEVFGIWGNGLTLLATALALPWLWRTPSPGDLALHAFAGIVAGSGFLLLVVAHARAPVSVLAPFQYSQMIYGIVLGVLLFGDLPRPATMVGAAVVVASGLYIFHREAVRRREVGSS